MTDQAEGQSPEDRMMALLDAEEEQGSAEEEQPQEAQAQEEPQEEAEPEQEAEAQPAKVKLKWNGEEVEKDLNEVVELAQQGYDYTKKTQSLAEERKAIEAQAQAIKAQESMLQERAAVQQALIKDFAKISSVDESIEQFNSVDWNALTDSDPVQAQKLFYQYSQLTNQRNKLVAELNQKQEQLAQQQQAHYQELLAKGVEQLKRDIPDWNQDKAKELRDTGKALGFTDQELSSVVDPRMVRVLWEASQFRKLQSSKPQIQNKVAGKPPVVKPGSKDSNAANKAEVRQLRESLSKRGRLEDAARLIEKTL